MSELWIYGEFSFTVRKLTKNQGMILEKVDSHILVHL